MALRILPALYTHFKVCKPFRLMSSAVPKFTTLNINNVAKHVYNVEINRPEKANAMNLSFWKEIAEGFHYLNEESDCRSIILSAKGNIFTAGIDMTDMTSIVSVVQSDMDIARKCKTMRKTIRQFQNAMSMPEKCMKPVIAAIQGGCIGGGVDLICSTDIRYCTKDAWFQVKEVDIGLAADVGTLQRLPLIVGSSSLARELVFTARKMFSDEAHSCGLVSRVFDDYDKMQTAALALASTIASKSPVAVQVSKYSLIYSRDNGVENGLINQADWNMTMLQSEDLIKSAMSQLSKNPDPPEFEPF